MPMTPSIADLNAADASTNLTQDTTLNTDNTDNSDDSGTNINDVLNSLIGIAPSLLILSRTPQQRLPNVTGNATSPVLKPPITALDSNSIMIMFIILIMVVFGIIVLGRKG